MSKTPKKGSRRSRPVKALVSTRAAGNEFDEVIALIESARTRAFAAVNTELIDLYLRVGEYHELAQDHANRPMMEEPESNSAPPKKNSKRPKK